MAYMKNLKDFIMDRRPIFCKECGGRLFYQASGIYECGTCGEEDLDDFGKIKKYLDEKGRAVPAAIIADDTGVPIDIINTFLRNGRLEIPEGSNIYIKCEKCGCALRYGRYCYDCTKSLVGELHGAFFEHVGDQPKNEKKQEGKMRFLEGKEKR